MGTVEVENKYKIMEYLSLFIFVEILMALFVIWGTTGAKILEVDWILDMREARSVVPENTVLMGNIDPSFPLVLCTPEQIDEAVKNLVEATNGRRYIISSECAMDSNTPPENFNAL